MRYSSKTLPEHVRRLMPKETRKGLACPTSDEAQAKLDAKSERVLQEQIVALCRQRNLFYIQSRMDRKTTVRKGLFDFTVFIRRRCCNPRLCIPPIALAIEVKTDTGKLRPEQQEAFADYEAKTGYPAHIVRSLEQFKSLLDAHQS